MESKTIGKFIAALRKANGMTQKELADKLNVSDKTVSRWERDDGAPDLSVVPVIAEIFGVTCDELLRGERKPISERVGEPEEPSAKALKQRQRILTMSLSKYRTRSFISMGIGVVGLIAAMICNLGFNRGYIGFFTGMIFCVASLVCQAVFINSAFLSVSDDEPACESVGKYKNSVIHLAKTSVFISLVLLGGTLPLIIFPNDAYSGLEGTSWLLTGLAFGVLIWVLCAVVWYFLHAKLVCSGILTLRHEEEIVFWHNHKLKRACAAVLSAVLLVTCVVQMLINGAWSVSSISPGTQFSDYESFIEFMGQDVPYSYSASAGAVAAEPIDSIYYDEHGNEISEDEALREEFIIWDGGEEKVVCEYIWRNHSVVSIVPAADSDGLPVTVHTQSEYEAAYRILDLINTVFVPIYAIQVLITALVYRKKRAK